MEDTIISGITYSKTEAKVTLTGLPALTDVSYKILEPIGSANIGVDMIMHNGMQNQYRDFSFTINREYCQQAQIILQTLNKQLGAQGIDINEKIGKLSVVGMGLKSNPGIATKILQTLVEEGITIYNIVTSEIKISILIDEKYIELGVRVLHEAFALDKI
jgi:aspartate kinase